jgi:hypothetical protein
MPESIDIPAAADTGSGDVSAGPQSPQLQFSKHILVSLLLSIAHEAWLSQREKGRTDSMLVHHSSSPPTPAKTGLTRSRCNGERQMPNHAAPLWSHETPRS